MSDDAHQMADIVETVEISSVELKKLKRIELAAEVVVKGYWKFISEADAKEELRDAVYDYKGWCEYYV